MKTLSVGMSGLVLLACYMPLCALLPAQAKVTSVESMDLEENPPVFLKVLLKDSIFHDSSKRHGAAWDNIVKLARSLVKVNDLENFYDHRGRPRLVLISRQ